MARRKVGTLYLYGEGHSRWDKSYGARVLNIRGNRNGRMAQYKSWKGFAKAILKYRHIDRLVIASHGAGGALIIGSEYKDLDSQFVKDLFYGKKKRRRVARGRRATRLRRRTLPRIDAIEFEGCNVARRPSKMVVFAKMFKARKVTGWTFYGVVSDMKVEAPRGVSASALTRMLRPYRKYLLPGNPTAATMARKAQRRTRKFRLILRWFREAFDASPLQPNRERTFRPLSAATQRTITESDVPKVEKEYESPVRPFEHLTVKITY